MMVGLGRDSDGAVLGREDAIGNERRMVVAARACHAALHRILVNHLLGERENRVVHRDVHELALSSAARGMDRGDHSESGKRARIGIANIRAGAISGAAFRPGEADQPAHRLRYHVEAGPVRVGARAGSGVAEAADSGVDQRGLSFMKLFVTKAETVHRPGSRVLDQGIGSVDQLEQRRTISLVLEVQNDAALVAIDAREVTAVSQPLVSGGMGPIPRGGSPPGGSTLITSAPRSASSIVQNGPARYWVRSMIRMSASGPVRWFMTTP